MNEELQEVAVEETENSGTFDFNLDAAWSDGDDYGTQPEAEVDVDQTETEESGTDETKDESNADEAKETDQFSLPVKHLDESRNLTREEAIEFAQKGMDWKRIHDKLDEANKRIAEYQDEHKFLESLKTEGSTIKELMISTRKNILVGEGKSEEEAEKLAKEEFVNVTLPKAVPTLEEEIEDRRKSSMALFEQRHPELKGKEKESITQEMWDDFWKGDNPSNNLEASYYKVLYTKAKEELDIYKQNETNKKSSIGSAKSNGNGKQTSITQMIANAWNED